jgi:type I restriction enzyme S subunit
MEGWQDLLLGEVIQLEYGKPLDPADRCPSGLYPAYGANGEKDRTNKFYRDKPSIIVGRKGSAGELTLTEAKFWPLDVTYFVEFDRTRHDLLFLYYLLKTLDLPSLAKGVKPGVNRNEVYALPVKVPTLPDQRRIVAILEEAFEAIATAKANTEKNLQNARELLGRYLSTVFAAPGDGWETRTLGEAVRFIDYRGKTPPKRKEGIRLITAKNVKMGFIRREPEEFIDSSVYDGWMTRGFPTQGDVLFTTEAPLGNVAQLDTEEKVVIGQRLITMQPLEATLDRTFLKYALMSPPIQASIHAKGTGATVLGIKASLLKTVHIWYPIGLGEQQRLVGLISAIEEEASVLGSLAVRKLAALDELKKSLLHQAFTGELTAKSTYRELEAVA